MSGTAVRQSQFEVFPERSREKIGFLGNISNVFSDFLSADLCGGCSVKEDFAVLYRVIADNQLEKCALADPARSGHGQPFARLHVYGEIVKDISPRFVISERDVLRFDPAVTGEREVFTGDIPFIFHRKDFKQFLILPELFMEVEIHVRQVFHDAEKLRHVVQKQDQSADGDTPTDHKVRAEAKGHPDEQGIDKHIDPYAVDVFERGRLRPDIHRVFVDGFQFGNLPFFKQETLDRTDSPERVGNDLSAFSPILHHLLCKPLGHFPEPLARQDQNRNVQELHHCQKRMNADQHHKHDRAYCEVGQHLREVHDPEEDIFHRFRPAIGRKFPGVIGVKEPQGLVHDLLKAFDEKHLAELPTGNGDSVLLKRTDSCVDDGKDNKEDDAEQNCFHVPVRNVDVDDPAHDNSRKKRDQTDGQIKDERERDVQGKMRYAVADKFIRCFIVVHDSFLSL